MQRQKKKLTKEEKKQKKLARQQERKFDKEMNKRYKMGLNKQLTVMTAVPIICVAVVAMVLSYYFQQLLVNELLQDEMLATSIELVQLIEMSDDGDYSVSDDGTYMKGDLTVSELNDLLAMVETAAGVNITMFYETEMMATGISDDTDALDESIYEYIEENDAFYDSNVIVNDEECFCYYLPLQQADHTVTGVVRISIERSSIMSGVYKRELIMCLIIVVIAGGLLVFDRRKQRKMVRAINKTTHMIEMFAEGEVYHKSESVIVKRKDEFGAIGIALDSLSDSLTDSVGTIKQSIQELTTTTSDFSDSFDTIANSTSDIDDAVNDIAHGATNQAAEAQNTNVKINNISQAIQETASKVESLSQRSDTMKDYGVSAQDILKELIDSNEKTKDSIISLKKQTELTNNSAADIQSALDIITGITQQTNLLSLNASIEAARAGEAGKGFAVVADEIRNLANQSSDSAGKIEEIVNNLIQNSQVSVDAMNEVSDIVLKQTEKLSESLGTFEELISEVEKSADDTAGIKTQTESLEKLRDDISDAIDKLLAIAEQNAAGTEETAATVTTLNTVVESSNSAVNTLKRVEGDLSSGIGRFKVE